MAEFFSRELLITEPVIPLRPGELKSLNLMLSTWYSGSAPCWKPASKEDRELTLDEVWVIGVESEPLLAAVMSASHSEPLSLLDALKFKLLLGLWPIWVVIEVLTVPPLVGRLLSLGSADALLPKDGTASHVARLYSLGVILLVVGFEETPHLQDIYLLFK